MDSAMFVLVVNCGSSSLKAALVDAVGGQELGSLQAERVGRPGTSLVLGRDGGSRSLAIAEAADHGACLAAGLPSLLASLPGGAALAAVGHRVVHGGERFTRTQRIDDAVEADIQALSVLAPLHNPANLSGIRAALALLPELPQFAVFDTAFHSSLPPHARAYALPRALVQKHSLRRFGFHGTSHAFVAAQAAAWLHQDLSALRIITCHLGNGASITAVEHGRSVETSMGLTPLDGLVMGTRSGEVDPGILLTLMRQEGLDVDGLDRVLNRESGLAGLSGRGPDMRDIEAAARAGDPDASLALDVFCHRLRKYIGAYAAVMGGLDCLVFTAGIGENSATVRRRACERLEFLGVQLDPARNEAVRVGRELPVAELGMAHGRVRILAIHTDEQLEIARQVRAALSVPALAPPARIPIAISARHVHLTQAAVETLFGPGHQLQARAPLSQPGQFSCEETLTLVGPRQRIEGVRVLGPVRPACQVEISRTDERLLGIDAPVRLSGEVAGSAPIVLEGPAGRLELAEGAICAWRHIHMPPQDAEALGLKHGDRVEVRVDSEGRDLVFGDVVVRVSDAFVLEMHVDTDEANAAELHSGQPGVLAATDSRAQLSTGARAIQG